MLKPGSIRFILAITVILYHITKIVFLGEFAVLCFFMLSGYWITFMYENKYKKLKSSLKVFYVSRMWRLFPVFLLFNCLTFMMCYFFKPEVLQSIQHQTLSGQMIFWFSNFFILGYNFINPRVLVTAWSLDIEFQFYLIYPLILAALKKAMNSFLIFSLIITTVITFFYAQDAVQKTLLYYLFFFIIGILIYLKNLQFSKRVESFATVVFIVMLSVNYLIPDLKKMTVVNNASEYNVHLNEIMPLLLIPLFSNSLKNRSTPLDRTLGNMSFVLYLCHWTLIVPYNYYVKGYTITQRLPYSAIYIIATLIVSYLIYKYFDNPIDNLRRKWVESQEVLKSKSILV